VDVPSFFAEMRGMRRGPRDRKTKGDHMKLPAIGTTDKGAIAGFSVGAIAIFAVLALVAFLSYFTVDAGHVGVIKRFGAVQEGVYDPGLHFKIPLLDSVVHVDTRLSSVNASAGAASKDLQVVTTEVSVPYYLEPSLVPAMINALGTREAFERSVLAPAIQESVKGSTAAYSAEELITKRGEAKAKIVTAINTFVNDTLNTKGVKGAAPIANVGIKDFDFSKGFNDSIEAKVRMSQDAARAEIEKVKRITDAEAKTAEIKLAADAEAYRVTKEAESRAGAIHAEGQALRENPSIIQLRYAEKWDGVLPRFNGGQLPLFLLDPQKDDAPRPAQNAVR
jgi:prohibitin 2